MKQRLLGLDIVRNRYFVLGSAIGKGASIATLPLVLLYFGAPIFAQYVLLYSYVQVIALVGILGANNALIPLWLDYPDKEECLSALITLMLAMSAVTYIPIAVVLYFVAPISVDVLHPALAVGLILSYAMVHNFFVTGQALLRVESKQMSFFWMGVGGAILLIALLVLFRNTNGNRLAELTLINIAALLFQVIFAFKSSGVPFRVRFTRRSADLSKAVLRLSAPLAVYMLVGSVPSVLDKWLVDKYFSGSVFSAYTLNFQFAFAVNIIANVVNIYNSPRVCELYHLGDVAGLKSNLKTNYSIVGAGTLCIGLSLFIYAWITHVPLGIGYWVLLAAFGLCNLFAINTTYLVAERRTALLSMIGFMGVACFLSAMAFAIEWRFPVWTYVAQLISATVLAGGSLMAIKVNLSDGRLAASRVTAGIPARTDIGDGVW